jgi:membrane protease YdiL (CAAX protease family)
VITSGRQYVGLAIVVLVWYLGLSYLPQVIGTCLFGRCDYTAGELVATFAIPLAFAAVPVVLEVLLYRKGLARALSDIGVTRFSWTGIRLALAYLLPLVCYFPLFSLVSNVPLALKPTWPWHVCQAVLTNGLAEETMMRGFVFRHLREGRAFWLAAALSTVYFAGYHLPLIVTEGVLVGVIGVLVAVPTGLLTAYIYERGANTIWGSALLHAGNNALIFVVAFPPEVQPIATSLYLVLGIVVATALLVWAYRGRYGRPAIEAVPQPSVGSA